MLTRMAMRFDGVAVPEIEYALGIDCEHEHRDAEHEHEEEPERSDADEGLGLPSLTCVGSSPGTRSMQPFGGGGGLLVRGPAI